MNRSHEVHEFLRTRRARISPAQAGLAPGGRRRVPGLRREEVASLACITVDYYGRLERGDLRGVSDSVLNAVAAALQMTEAETAYLHDLARAAQSGPPSGAGTPDLGAVPTIEWLLNAMDGVPAYLRNARFDILDINSLGRAVFPHLAVSPGDEVNLARYTFLDPRARSFYVDWDEVARVTVHALRLEAGHHPQDHVLGALIGELLESAPEFETWWSEHDVAFHDVGRKTVRHPVAGELDLWGQRLEVPFTRGVAMFTFVTEPGSPSAHALAELAGRVGVSGGH